MPHTKKSIDMRICGGTLLALALSAAACAASAQGAPTPPGAAGSVPEAARLGPRRMSPTELRESATQPGDLRPVDGVTPQIVIPLRPGAAAVKAPGSARRSAAAASAGIDDGVAHCEAASSRSARERCLLGRTKATRQR